MSVTGKSNPLTVSGLVVFTLIWSYSWIPVKQVISYIGAFGFIALCCVFDAPVLSTILLLYDRGMRPTPFKYILAIALLQTCGVVDLTQWALVNDGTGGVTILSYTVPFWVVIFATLFPGERLRRGQYSTVLIAAFGLFLVLQPRQLDLPSMKSAILAILSSVDWGAGAIAAKRLCIRHPRMDLLSLTSWQILHTTLVMSMVALLVPQRGIDWQSVVFWALAYSAILATVLVRSLWLLVLKDLPASTASLSTLTAPIYDILPSWWLLGEDSGAAESGSIVLIVLVLALMSRKKKEAISVKRI